MSSGRFTMPGGWEEPFSEQAPPETITSPPFTNYRVRNIDAAFEKSSLELSLKSALQLSDNEDLRVWSLAPCLVHPTKKVATMSLKRNTRLLKPGLMDREIFLDEKVGTSAEEPVTIDGDFLGLTPLNDPNDTGGHKFDVIAITGIGGHAFGSFRVNGGEYMWLRDALPEHLPGARIMIYGYDSQIAGSKSFQGLRAIALTFKNTLQSVKQTKPIPANPIPILLICHSMGGLVIKKAICQMSEGDENDKTILKCIYGILFFGVPNQGMENKSLVAMARGQPNEFLIHSLGTESDYLKELHASFQNAFTFSTSIIFSFFETEMSPTAVKINGEWKMSGPEAILVGSDSATQGRSGEKDDLHMQPINRTHSRLVKFKRQDQYYDIVLNILRGFTGVAISIIMERLSKIALIMKKAQKLRPLSVAPRLSWPLNTMKSESPTEKRPQFQAVLDYSESSLTAMSKSSHDTNMDSFQLSINSQSVDLGSSQEMQRHSKRLQDAFLQSITTNDFQATKIIPNSFEDTCQWVYKKKQYETWRKDEPFPKALVIVAGTGRGKSVLAKYLSRELNVDRSGQIVLSFFCKNDNAERETAANIIQQLIKQLLLARPTLLRQLSNQILERGTQAKGIFQPLWEIFITLVSITGLGPVYCIIDGLDECDKKSRILICDSVTRDVLSSNEPAILSAKVRILITSQSSPEVLDLGEASSLLWITPSDVRQDIYNIVHEGISKVSSKNIVSVELATAIEQILREKADGMFQWAALVLEDLNASNTLHAESRILELFRIVPASLNGLYKRALSNIAIEDSPIARKILGLLLFASRPLTELELTFGFALIDENEDYHRHSDIIRSGNLEPTMGRLAKAVCGSFLKFSEEDRLLAISHESARYFLANHQETQGGGAVFNIGKGHLTLAKICLEYLLLEEIRSESDSEDDETLHNRYPFLKYAESSWDYHLMEVDDLDLMRPLVYDFFNRYPNLRAWKVAWPELMVHFPDYQNTEGAALLHLLVHCRLSNVLSRCTLVKPVDDFLETIGPEDAIVFLETDVDVVDFGGRTALMASVQAGNLGTAFIFHKFKANLHLKDDRGSTLAHLAVLSGDAVYLKFLRDSSVDLYVPNVYGFTPLYFAICLDNRDAIEILLESDPKYNNITGETALHLAALAGNCELVRNLLLLEPDVNRKTNDGDTFLKLGVQSTNQKVVELLLARNPDPDLPDKLGWTPLHMAAFHGLESTIEALLAAFPHTNIASHDGVTPLMAACQSGSIIIVNRLLPMTSNVNFRDEDGETALHYAVRARSIAIIDVLIAHEADINIVNSGGTSVLHIAASEGLESIAKILLCGEKIVVDPPLHHSGRTPLYDAARSGCENLVAILLKHGANPEGIIFDMVSDRNDIITALQAAASIGSIKVVEHLVSAGANLNATWRGGFTPLHAASINNHTEVIAFLLDKGADPLCMNKDGITPQHYLARNGEKDILIRFLDAGASTMWKEGNDTTLLHWASKTGSESVVRLLLERGVSVSSCDENGGTALHEAASAGHVDICKILLERDINLDLKDNEGRSALHRALGRSQSTVAELLLSRHPVVDSADSLGWTPLHLASRGGLGRVVQLILLELMSRKFSKINCLNSRKATPILAAVVGRHVSVARLLIRSGANVDMADAEGWTPLHWAAEGGSKELVRILVQETSNIDPIAIRGVTPLTVALSRGIDEIVQILLMSGASTHVPYNAHSSLICYAARYCNPETVRNLIKLGARRQNDDASPLESAVQRNDGRKSLEIIETLLQDGANPNLQDSFGNTPLHIAAMIGHRKAVHSLVAAGGDLGLIDCYGRTAYYWAKRLKNNYLHPSLKLSPPTEPDEAIRSNVVEKSISRCIVWLKKSRGNRSSLYEILGNCLKFQNDPKNAVVAFEQRITRNEEGYTQGSNCKAPFHPYPYTDNFRTKEDTNVPGAMYICMSCESVAICENCFKKRENQEGIINGCFSHEFLVVPRPEWESFPKTAVEKDGKTVQEWLKELRDTTEDEIDGLQIWRTGRWTQAFAWRQVFGGMWAR